MSSSGVQRRPVRKTQVNLFGFIDGDAWAPVCLRVLEILGYNPETDRFDLAPIFVRQEETEYESRV